MIETGIICDPVSNDVEDDWKEIEERLRLFELPIDVVLRGVGMHQIKDRSLDLLVIDYGAMSLGASSTGEWQVRSACEWAENHPGSLLVIWTWFTQRLYERELREQFGHIDNIISYFPNSESLSIKLEKWFAHKVTENENAQI